MFMTKTGAAAFAGRRGADAAVRLMAGARQTPYFQKPSGCVWSVWALDKKKEKLSPLARFRGFIQAGATLLTNLHLPNFAKERCIRAAESTSACRG